MESNNLTTRTYTAPTCTLIVASKEKQVSRINPQQQHDPIDFILHLGDPDRGDLVDCLTLQGQPQQLDRLQQVVSKYISELVAKFPLPTTEIDSRLSAPTQIQGQDPDDASMSGQLYPNRETQSTRSGIIKNLPGLRNSPSSNPIPPSNPVPQTSLVAKQSISMFFLNRLNKQNNRKNDLGAVVPPESQVTPAASGAPTTPYLTGGEQSLDHHLHLGNLATAASGEVLTLSAIQLFDLASVLDEYVAEGVTTPTQAQPNPLNRSSIPGNENNTADVDTTAVPLSRLPNLPRIPAVPTGSQVYYQTRRSRSSSSFVSAMPWAIAAALAVGVPLLLLDPNPNPVKDIASKVKIPGVAGTKKPVTSLLAKQQQSKLDRTNTASVPTAAVPAPWQAQPVQPPQVPKQLDTGVQTPQNSSKIGIAPLPATIIGNPGQSTPAAVTGSGAVKPGVVASILPRNNGLQSGVAPNPLNTNQLPSDTVGIGNSTGLPIDNATPKTISKPSVTAPNPQSIATGKSTTKASKLTPLATRLPSQKSAAIDPNTISISKQPILMPPTDLPVIPTTAPNIQPVPLNTTGIGMSEPQKVTKPKVKLTAVANKPKSKTVKQTAIQVTPQASFEPFTPVPRNPNLINPEENTPAGSEPQNPPVIPNQPLQSNAGGTAADPADSPLLQETKRYFQDKWKANTTQPNSLQYVIQVSGKSGIVRSVVPQGEAATTYLQQTKLIKPGQKLISPAAAGSSDQKIRVLLEPDGNVDTFSEP